MRIPALVGGLLAVTVFTVAGNQTVHAQTQDNQTEKAKKVEVEPGDSLIKIAKSHDTTYIRLFDANKDIKHPDLIYPGDKVRIPHPDEKLKSRPLPDSAVAVAPTPKQRSIGYIAPAPKQRSTPVIAPVYSGGSSVWDRLAQCEAGGNWSINTGNGYYGGLQFTLSSWRAAGGSGYPHQASKSEQIARGIKLKSIQGWGAWPACSAKLGLR